MNYVVLELRRNGSIGYVEYSYALGPELPRGRRC